MSVLLKYKEIFKCSQVLCQSPFNLKIFQQKNLISSYPNKSGSTQINLELSKQIWKYTKPSKQVFCPTKAVTNNMSLSEEGNDNTYYTLSC